MSFAPARLDVDPSILDTNLMVVGGREEEQLASLLPPSLLPTSKVEELDSLLPTPDYPSVTAVPRPGICVKTRNAAGEKFFLNLCKLAEVPPPPPMEAAELERMIAEEDYTNLWRVPMSLGQPRKEKDKAGAECWAAEVAVNTAWFDNTMKDSEVFTGFVITVAIEGLGDKYGACARLDRDHWTVLKNKKALGEALPAHRVQQRAAPGIQQVTGAKAQAPPKAAKSKSLPVPAAKAAPVVTEVVPEYRMVAEPSLQEPRHLRVEVEVPGVRSGREVLVDVGEDRLVVCATRLSYLLDIFLPFSMESEGTTATFIKDQQKLVILIPVSQ